MGYREHRQINCYMKTVILNEVYLALGFRSRCPIPFAFGQDTRPVREYFELIPDGYCAELLNESRLADRGQQIYFINDEQALWLL